DYYCCSYEDTYTFVF
nr:immunoglobulin light chain junction region [Macaca mulatta]